MPTFAPPHGQRCQTCRCWTNHNPEAGYGMCALMPPPNWPDMAPEQWCGHWRANHDTRCGSCDFFRSLQCPKVTTGHITDDLKQDFGPADITIACEQYELNPDYH